QGVGVRAFVKDVLPRLARYDTVVLVNVCGDTVEEYAEVARILDGAPGVHGLEINISCPNVKKGGMAFGGDPVMTHEVVAAVREVKIPVIGVGGITSARDALEFLIAGCRAVQIGTANFVDPGLYDRMLEELAEYLERNGLSDVNEVVGTLQYPLT